MQVLDIECDILVVGGGLGGVAAALRACRAGRRRRSQSTGPRAHYRQRYELSSGARQTPFLNPGGGWVSRLSFEPEVGVAVLLDLLLPEVEAGRLQIHYGARPTAVDFGAGRVRSVTLDQSSHRRRLRCRPVYVLDATELGDLLPLTGIPYVTGAESREQTGEPDARGDGLTLRYGERDLTYKVFELAPELPGAFWTYRRILAADRFAPGQVEGDLAMINWAGNDFKGGNLIDLEEDERGRILQHAKELSLGFLHWLQTEVPRDDGRGRGYPELRLRPGRHWTYCQTDLRDHWHPLHTHYPDRHWFRNR